MITILHFLFDYSGEKRYSTELLAGLADHPGFDIRLVRLHNSDTMEFSIEQADGYRIVNIPRPAFTNRKYDLATLFPVYIRLIDHYEPLSERVIVHVNQLDKLNIGRMKLDGIDCKIVFTLHFLLEEARFGDMKKLIFTDANIEGVYKLIALTRYGRGVMTGTFGVPEEKTCLIYNGIRLHHGEPTDRDGVRAMYGFGPDETLLLFVGTVSKGKGLFGLTKVFADISKAVPGVRLVIAGTGAFDQLFGTITSNHSRITVLGRQTPEQVHALYRACDIGIMPSLLEQCSYVALEMMSHGLPFVATEIRGMAELFENRRVALTVPVVHGIEEATMDEEVLKEHILTLIADEALRRELGENGRREWEEHYTHTAMTAKTVEIYESLFR